MSLPNLYGEVGTVSVGGLCLIQSNNSGLNDACVFWLLSGAPHLIEPKLEKT